jgi:hypothetical protein
MCRALFARYYSPNIHARRRKPTIDRQARGLCTYLLKTGYLTRTTQQPLNGGGNVADSTRQFMSIFVELFDSGAAELFNKDLSENST